jgi:hypothetical protein
MITPMRACLNHYLPKRTTRVTNQPAKPMTRPINHLQPRTNNPRCTIQQRRDINPSRTNNPPRAISPRHTITPTLTINMSRDRQGAESAHHHTPGLTQ